MSGQAVFYRGAGDVGVIEIAELPDSHARPPGVGEVAVAVAAVGLNRADILQRRGFYPAPPGVEPDIPGLEFAGVVESAGPGARLEAGTRVMGITSGGAFSSRLVVRKDQLVRVPDKLELSAAAAVPEAFFTAYDALVSQARLGVGERVLIHAAASGVGTAAIQIARRIGATVVGTSRTAAKIEPLAALGLDHGIVCTEPQFASAMRKACGGRGADVVLDLIGAAYFGENLLALEPTGRMVIIGLLGGLKADAPLAVILAKRLEIRGSVLRSRTAAEKASLAQAFAKNLSPMFADGRLVPVIDRVMPMSDIEDAHGVMERNETTGKIVLAWD